MSIYPDMTSTNAKKINSPQLANELRSNVRYPFNVTVVYKLGEVSCVFHTENISTGGMKLNAPIDPKIVDISGPVHLTVCANMKGKEYRFQVRGFFHARDSSVIVFDEETQELVSLILTMMM